MRAGIQADGLSAEELRGELLQLARYGRVLVLLDACHSGAMTMNHAGITLDADALRIGLAAANVTVLTSSSGSETSQKRDAWQHGPFTKVLLDAFNDPAADTNRNGLISTTGLANDLAKRVPALTDGAQTPGMEIRFDSPCLPAGRRRRERTCLFSVSTGQRTPAGYRQHRHWRVGARRGFG